MPRIPRALLTERLMTLEDAGVFMRKSVASGILAEYHLTKAGSDLLEAVIKLADWGPEVGQSRHRHRRCSPDVVGVGHTPASEDRASPGRTGRGAVRLPRCLDRNLLAGVGASGTVSLHVGPAS